MNDVKEKITGAKEYPANLKGFWSAAERCREKLQAAEAFITEHGAKLPEGVRTSLSLVVDAVIFIHGAADWQQIAKALPKAEWERASNGDWLTKIEGVKIHIISPETKETRTLGE